jgi:tetratricopeptide (TPR) repeat protein
MTIVVRVAATIAVAFIFVYALYTYAYLPLHCNIVEMQVETRTVNAYRAPGSIRSEIVARNNLEDLRACSAAQPTNVNDAMLTAANFDVLGRNDLAVQQYQKALLYDRRPEIYLNLGLDLLQMGRGAEAQRALVTASLFNPELIDEIPYDDVRASVQREVSATIASWSAAHPPR